MDPKDPATPGDITTPPVEPAAPVVEPSAPSQTPPAGSEPDTNAGDPGAMVPSDRLREETEKRRKAEERAQELEQQLAQSKQPQTPQNDDDDLDPETEEIIRKGAKKLGLVSQAELDKRNLDIQVQQDVKDLETTPPSPGIPYDHKAVMEYAQANNLPITSKSALQAAYKELNWNKIMEGERQRAIEGYKTAGSSSAESPGSGGPQPPSEPEITSKNPKERTRERIRLARQKLQV